MSFTNSTTAFLAPAQLQHLSAHYPIYYAHRVELLDGIPDHYLALAAPIIAYWVFSLFFHLLDISPWTWLNKYRIHESEEVKSRNLVSRTDVLTVVISQHIGQTLVGFWWIEEKPTGSQIDHVANMLQLAPAFARLVRLVLREDSAQQLLRTHGMAGLYTLYWWAIPLAKFFFAMFIMDTWQYFIHRAMHKTPWLYKNFHSWHHRLYVPYAFGALYNHPLEGLLVDTAGAGIAELLSRLSTRQATLLFCMSMLKSVDDHCGYRLPWDPFQFLSPNNASFHDIHHQVIGIKSNFSQPFFIHWDTIFGTRMTCKDIEERCAKQKAKTE